MRADRLIIPLVLMCAPGWAQLTLNRATLPQKLGFEDQIGPSLTGWYSNPSGSVITDDVVVHSGQRAIRVERDGKTSGGFSELTGLLPIDFTGQRIELRGYLKLQDVTGYAGLWLREDSDDRTLLFNSMESQQLKGTRDWAEYRIALPIDPTAQKIYFDVISGGTGMAWVDDLQLLVDGKPIGESPTAPVTSGLPVDQAFGFGSGIITANLSSTQISNLVTLGRVWGFLKYHHPACRFSNYLFCSN